MSLLHSTCTTVQGSDGGRAPQCANLLVRISSGTTFVIPAQGLEGRHAVYHVPITVARCNELSAFGTQPQHSSLITCLAVYNLRISVPETGQSRFNSRTQHSCQSVLRKRPGLRLKTDLRLVLKVVEMYCCGNWTIVHALHSQHELKFLCKWGCSMSFRSLSEVCLLLKQSMNYN